jgi:hypothetical protein
VQKRSFHAVKRSAWILLPLTLALVMFLFCTINAREGLCDDAGERPSEEDISRLEAEISKDPLGMEIAGMIYAHDPDIENDYRIFVTETREVIRDDVTRIEIAVKEYAFSPEEGFILINSRLPFADYAEGSDPNESQGGSEAWIQQELNKYLKEAGLVRGWPEDIGGTDGEDGDTGVTVTPTVVPEPPQPPGGITNIGDLPGPGSWPQAATGILLPPLFGTLMGIIYILFGGGTTPPRGAAAPPAGPDLQSITDIPYGEVQFPDAGAVLSTAVQESTGGGVQASKEALGIIPALKDIFDRGIYTAVYFGEGVLKDIASLGTDFMAGSFILSTLARRQIERGPEAIMGDALDWVGDTVVAGIYGAVDLLPDSGPVAEVFEDTWRRFWDVNEKAVDVFSHIIRAPVEDPVSFASSLLGKDNWGKVIDPDVPFSERLGRVVYGSVDMALTIEGVSQIYKGVAKGAGKEALEGAGRTAAAERAAAGAEIAVSAERKAVYESIKEIGKGKVDDLEGVYKNVSTEDAADMVRKNTRKQVIECLGDNQSKYEINMRTGEEAARIRSFVEKEANKITSEAGEAARKKLAEGMGLNADDVRVRTYTNPKEPGKAQVPLDADVTFQRRARGDELIRDPDSPGGWRRAEGGADEWVDVPAKDAQPVYNETLYETSGGKEYFPDMSADDFARKLDHNVTDSRHLEAFPEFERLTTGARVLDSDGVSKVMGYKYYKEAAEAAKVSDPALAEDLLMKGMRQLPKAYEKQVSKIQVLSEKGAGPRVPRVPPRLEEAVKGMDKMVRANASPAEIEAYLKSIGYTTDKVAEQVGGIYDAVNKVWRTM